MANLSDYKAAGSDFSAEDELRIPIKDTTQETATQGAIAFDTNANNFAIADGTDWKVSFEPPVFTSMTNGAMTYNYGDSFSTSCTLVGKSIQAGSTFDAIDENGTVAGMTGALTSDSGGTQTWTLKLSTASSNALAQGALSLKITAASGLAITETNVMTLSAAPVWTGSANLGSANSGASFDCSADYNRTLTYTASGLPTGYSINSSTGLVSGTVGSTFSGSFTVTATDTEDGSTHQRTFSVTITVFSTDTYYTGSNSVSTLQVTTPCVLEITCVGGGGTNGCCGQGGAGGTTRSIVRMTTAGTLEIGVGGTGNTSNASNFLMPAGSGNSGGGNAGAGSYVRVTSGTATGSTNSGILCAAGGGGGGANHGFTANKGGSGNGGGGGAYSNRTPGGSQNAEGGGNANSGEHRSGAGTSNYNQMSGANGASGQNGGGGGGGGYGGGAGGSSNSATGGTGGYMSDWNSSHSLLKYARGGGSGGAHSSSCGGTGGGGGAYAYQLSGYSGATVLRSGFGTSSAQDISNFSRGSAGNANTDGKVRIRTI